MEVIDPFAIPASMSTSQKEDWMLFGVLVANKSAAATRRKLTLLLDGMQGNTPFEKLRLAIDTNTLMDHLHRARTGQYTRIAKALAGVVKLNPDKLTVGDLEAIHGIGPKTARMTLLYCEPDQEVVPLDTHVLKYLKGLGYDDVPKATPPSGSSYNKWEGIFIEEAHKADMSVREFDTYVWQMFAKSSND